MKTRAFTASVLLLVLLALMVVFTLGIGAISVAPLDVIRTLLGNGSRMTNFAVLDLRLPRVVVAAGVGIALGLSGAVFQSLSRNPLGSPDIVGFTYGSATGALAVIVLLGGSSAAISLGAVVGGLLTALLV